MPSRVYFSNVVNLWKYSLNRTQTTCVQQLDSVSRTRFSSADMNFSTFEPICHEFQLLSICRARIRFMRVWRPVCRESVGEVLFIYRLRLLHCLTSLSKSSDRLNSTCDLFSVLSSWSCSTFFLRIFLLFQREHMYLCSDRVI